MRVAPDIHRPTCKGAEMNVFKVTLAVSAAFVATTLVGAVAALRARRRTAHVVDEAADEVAVAGILGPMYFRSTASAFRGGSIDCWYGGGAVDLREARIDPAGARLRVRALFGGGQIVVPEAWRVVSHFGGLGRINDGRPAVERPSDAPVLTIEGFAVFGGFEITSEIGEEEVSDLRDAVARYEEKLEAAPA
jgi:hypothetical protein